MILKKYFIGLGLVIILLSLSFSVTHLFAANLANINFSPSTGFYKVGQTFNVSILVDPGAGNIDTVRVKLVFPPDILKVKNFVTSPNFSYQAGTNGFDNSKGLFSWGAGIPGGTTKTVSFGTVTFIVEKTGNARVAVSDGSMILSGGINKFSGQLNSTAYTLLPASVANHNIIKEQTSTIPQTTIPQVETQIIPNTQNSVASLANTISFATAIKLLTFVGIILLLTLMVFMLYKFIKKPALIYKNRKK